MNGIPILRLPWLLVVPALAMVNNVRRNPGVLKTQVKDLADQMENLEGSCPALSKARQDFEAKKFQASELKTKALAALHQEVRAMADKEFQEEDVQNKSQELSHGKRGLLAPQERKDLLQSFDLSSKLDLIRKDRSGAFTLVLSRGGLLGYPVSPLAVQLVKHGLLPPSRCRPKWALDTVRANAAVLLWPEQQSGIEPKTLAAMSPTRQPLGHTTACAQQRGTHTFGFWTNQEQPLDFVRVGPDPPEGPQVYKDRGPKQRGKGGKGKGGRGNGGKGRGRGKGKANAGPQASPQPWGGDGSFTGVFSYSLFFFPCRSAFYPDAGHRARPGTEVKSASYERRSGVPACGIPLCSFPLWCLCPSLAFPGVFCADLLVLLASSPPISLGRPFSVYGKIQQQIFGNSHPLVSWDVVRHHGWI